MRPDEMEPIEELLKRRAQAGVSGTAAGGPLCGDPELLAAYAENSLNEQEHESFQIHLAMCAACREEVAALVRMAPREVVTDVPAASASWWKRWIWVPALASVLVAGSVLLMNRKSVMKEPDRFAKAAVPAATPGAEPEKKVIVHKDAVPKVSKPPIAAAGDAALAGKPADAVEEVPADVKSPVAPQKEERAENAAPAPRKQERFAATDGTSLGVQNQSQRASLPPPPNVERLVQGQNFAPPAPSAQNTQNEGVYVVGGVPAQNAPADSNSVQMLDKKRMSPMAAPMNAQPAAPSPGGMAGAAAASAPELLAKKGALVAPAKGRIKKATLQLSTDGGATWQDITTPEPVLAFQITDALNIEIRTRSLSTFRTKDGGKTWQSEKTPQP